MKRVCSAFSFFAFAFVWLTLLSACGTGSTTAPSDDAEPLACEPNEHRACECPLGVGVQNCTPDGSAWRECACPLQPETKLKSGTKEVRGASLTVSEDGTELSAPEADAQQLTSLTPGEVIVRLEDTGFSGRVESVERKDGVVRVKTSPVRLKEAFDRLHLKLAQPINIDGFVPQEVLADSTKPMLGLSASAGGFTLKSAGNISPSLSFGDDSTAWFDPSVDLDIDLDWGKARLNRFKFGAGLDAGFEIHPALEITGSGSVSFDFDVIKAILQKKLEIPIGNGLSAQIEMNISCGMSTSGTVQFYPWARAGFSAGGGVAYTPQRGWNTYSHYSEEKCAGVGKTSLKGSCAKLQSPENKPQKEWDSRATLTCSVMPKFTLKFAGIVGVYAEAGPYAKGTLGSAPPRAKVDLGFKGNVGVSASLDIGVFEVELFDESYTLFDLSWTVLDYYPPVCGDGYRQAGEECDIPEYTNKGKKILHFGSKGPCLPDCTCRRPGYPTREPVTPEDYTLTSWFGPLNTCVPHFCGDGYLDPGELCDEGPNNGKCGGCDVTCKRIMGVCGDGIKECGELCDDGNRNDCDWCDNTCTESQICGNLRIDAQCGETCEDGNDNPNDGCDACHAYALSCGDGVRAGAEGCDDGNADDCDECHNDCTPNLNQCGDGHVCGAEECEFVEPPLDENGVPQPVDRWGCDADCTGSVCGDGYVNSLMEQCDETSPTCDPDCTLTVCGDGTLNLLVEECDGHTTADTWGCNGIDGPAPCKASRCGDGHVNTAVGEVCDDGDRDDCTPACNHDCTGPVPPAVCGDGVLSCGEVCDEGADNGRCGHCAADCKSAPKGVCGDGVVDAACGEKCDEGAANGSCGHCSNDCDHVLGKCGDGITDLACGEKCDDGDSSVCGTCNATCTQVVETCGNGVLDAQTCGEVCDTATDSATGYDVGCNALNPVCNVCKRCSADVCGDGIVGASEVCEPKGICELGQVCDGAHPCPAGQQCGLDHHSPGACNDTCTGYVQPP